MRMQGTKAAGINPNVLIEQGLADLDDQNEVEQTDMYTCSNLAEGILCSCWECEDELLHMQDVEDAHERFEQEMLMFEGCTYDPDDYYGIGYAEAMCASRHASAGKPLGDLIGR